MNLSRRAFIGAVLALPFAQRLLLKQRANVLTYEGVPFVLSNACPSDTVYLIPNRTYTFRVGSINDLTTTNPSRLGVVTNISGPEGY